MAWRLSVVDFGELRSACHQQGLGGLFQWLARVDRDKPLADEVWQYIKDTKGISMPDRLHRQYIYVMHRMDLDVRGSVAALTSIIRDQGWHSHDCDCNTRNRWLLDHCLPMMVRMHGTKIRKPSTWSEGISPPTLEGKTPSILDRKPCPHLESAGFKDVVSVASGLMPDPRVLNNQRGMFVFASVNMVGGFVLYEGPRASPIHMEWTPRESQRLLTVCLDGLSCEGYKDAYCRALYTTFYIHHKQMQRIEANP
jgi:hypothetical protein